MANLIIDSIDKYGTEIIGLIILAVTAIVLWRKYKSVTKKDKAKQEHKQRLVDNPLLNLQGFGLSLPREPEEDYDKYMVNLQKLNSIKYGRMQERLGKVKKELVKSYWDIQKLVGEINETLIQKKAIQNIQGNEISRYEMPMMELAKEVYILQNILTKEELQQLRPVQEYKPEPLRLESIPELKEEPPKPTEIKKDKIKYQIFVSQRMKHYLGQGLKPKEAFIKMLGEWKEYKKQ